jgi:hypothetical protein
MNLEIGTEAPIFLFWEYFFRNFETSVFCLCSVLYPEWLIRIKNTDPDPGVKIAFDFEKSIRKNIVKNYLFHIFDFFS